MAGWFAGLLELIKTMFLSMIEELLWALGYVLDRIRYQITIFKHKARLALAGLLEEKQGGLICILVGVAVIIFYVAMAPALLAIPIIASIGTFMANAKNAMKTWEGWLAFRTLVTLHNLGLLFSVEYQKWVSDVRVAVAALSAEVGESSNYLLSLFRNARAMIYATDGMLGLGIDYSEARWGDGVIKFLEKWNDRFDRYALDPSRIVADIDAEIITPFLYESREKMGELWDRVNKTWSNVSGIIDDVQELWGAWRQLQADLPPLVKEAWETRFSEFNRKMGVIVDDVLTPFQTRVNASIDIIQDQIDIVKAQHDRLEAQFEKYTPFASLWDTDFATWSSEMTHLDSFIKSIYGDRNAQARLVATRRRASAIELLENPDRYM